LAALGSGGHGGVEGLAAMSERTAIGLLLVLLAAACSASGSSEGDAQPDLPAADADADPPDDASTEEDADAGLDAVDDDQAGDDAGLDLPTDDAPADTPPECPPPDDEARGMWLWGADDVVDPAARAALFAFVAAKDVRVVFAEAESLLEETPDELAGFIAEAHAACVEVELLFGRADWALPANHERPRELVRRSADFAAAHPEARPAAVHFDVEPYTLAEWDADFAATARGWLDLMDGLAVLAHDGGLELVADVPFWWDGSSRAVDWGGRTKLLSEHAADVTDRLVLMDYRDTASGSDGIIALGADELAYAAAHGSRVVLGVETICGLMPELVSFCEEGEAAMDAELAAVREAYAGAPGFAGIAVHHYGSWRVLPR